jgi:hypothetical protein
LGRRGSKNDGCIWCMAAYNSSKRCVLLRSVVPPASWLLGTILTAQVAWAEPSAAVRNEADAVFHEARQLLANGSIRAACDAFARSHELLPRHGTLLNLAVCLEQQGDLVSAFHRFEESLSAAISDGRADRQELARIHIEDLRTKLGWLWIRVDGEGSTIVVEVFCDGVAIRKDSNTPMAVEPGSHVVTASATGRKPFEVIITIAAGSSETVRIPTLVAIEEPTAKTVVAGPRTALRSVIPTPLALAAPRQAVPEWRRPLSVSLIAAGTAALSVGAFCGFRAIVDGDAVERLCVDGRCTSDDRLSMAQRLDHRARVEARVANLALPLGAIAVGAGAYLIWTKPRDQRSTTGSKAQLQFAPTASSGAVGTILRGTW